MKRILTLLLLTVLSSASVFAHEAFKLVSSEKKIIKETEIAQFERQRTNAKKEKSNLIFMEKEIRLVVTTGPEDDMLSYRIQGVRNVNLIVPSVATLRILFINTDTDMRHDVRFGHAAGEFALAPEIAETVGTNKLTAKSEDGAFQAEEIVVKTNDVGAFKYFCSVRGHAKGGMWGNIFVGVEPGANVQMAEKKVHVHSPDEENEDPPHEDEKKPHDHNEQAEKSDAKTPATGHQHDDSKKANHQHDDKKSNSTKNAAHGEHNQMAGGTNHDAMQMRSTINLNEPMTREASGTAWVPDSSPMYARMKSYEDGSMLMMMGNMFFRYTNIGSSRDVSIGGEGGRSRFDAPSMFMGMYSKPVGKNSQIGFRAMMSLDPIIERGYGYPLLYQSGELYKGEPIHDRQHPHDLFSELAVTFSHRFNNKNSFFVYAGLPGEPSLGPPTFMHRISGMDNPDAPLGHHWQDATHITFGVVTAGYTYDKFKVEASAFNGTEPDENRWNFDKPRLSSYSARISFNPTKEWAFQISHGYLRNPERAEPEIKILRRTTASAIYNKKLSDDRNFASTFVWGQNYAEGERTNSYLFEADYQFRKNAIFGRLEQVQKSGHELVLDHPLDHDVFRIGAFSLGYLREFYRGGGLDFGVGAQVTFNNNPQALAPVYGGTNHQGFQIFFRVRPSMMNH